MAGFGGVMQDHLGNIITAKGGSIGMADSNMAEMVGLLEGLRILKKSGHMGCVIEGDSRTVISWGQGSSRASWRVAHFIQEIWVLVRDTQALLCHIPRSKNVDADCLVKWNVWQPRGLRLIIFQK